MKVDVQVTNIWYKAGTFELNARLLKFPTTAEQTIFS